MKRHIDIDEYNVKINNINGILQIMGVNLVIPFATIFAKRLNASDFQVALLNSLPAIISIGSIIPGVIYIQKCKDKKVITGKFFIFARFFYILFALIPFFPSRNRAFVFVLLYGLMNLPNSIALASWQSYISSLFRPSMIAGVLASRSRLSTLIGTIIILTTGWLMNSIPKTDGQRLILYQVFFVAATLIAIPEIIVFFKHKNPKDEDHRFSKTCSKDAKKDFKKVFKDMRFNKKFVYYCIVAVIFHFTWYMAWPLFPLYEIDYLHSNELWTSILVTIAGVSSAISYPYWGKLANKLGNSLSLTIATMLMIFSPLIYSNARSLYGIIPASIIGGVSTAGVLLLVLNTVYEVSPSQNRTLYIAIFNTALNVVLFIAPVFGIYLKNRFGIKVAFTVTVILRIFSTSIFFARYIMDKNRDKKSFIL